MFRGRCIITKTNNLTISHDLSRKRVLSLIYRNILTSMDKDFVFWQLIFFPMAYIFIAGYSFSTILDTGAGKIGDVVLSYPSYVTTGMIGINLMTMCTVAGSMIWNDKQHGMFEQILA